MRNMRYKIHIIVLMTLMVLTGFILFVTKERKLRLNNPYLKNDIDIIALSQTSQETHSRTQNNYYSQKNLSEEGITPDGLPMANTNLQVISGHVKHQEIDLSTDNTIPKLKNNNEDQRQFYSSNYLLSKFIKKKSNSSSNSSASNQVSTPYPATSSVDAPYRAALSVIEGDNEDSFEHGDGNNNSNWATNDIPVGGTLYFFIALALGYWLIKRQTDNKCQ